MDVLNHSWDSMRIKHLFEERVEKNSDSKNDYLSIVKDVGVIPYSEKGNVGNKTSDNPKNYKRVYPNDLVINPMNVTIGSVGISNYHGCLSNVYMVLKPRIEFDPQYYGYVFQIKTFQKSLRKISYGIMEIRESINKIEFFGLELPCPPYTEQQQIVSFLDSKTSLIDSLIEKTQRKVELLKEKRTSIINEVVTKGLNPNVEMKDSGVEWIGEIPSHWGFVKLKKLFFINKRISGELGYDVLSVTQKGLKVKDLENNEGQHSMDYSKYQLVYENDFVMNHMDLLTGFVDLSEQLGVTSPDYRVFTKSNERVHNQFYLYIFQLCYHRKIFYGLGRGVSNLGRWRLPSIEFLNMYLPFPDLREQQQIVEYLDEQTQLIDNTMSIEENRIELLKEYRQSLISEVVTGKRKVVE